MQVSPCYNEAIDETKMSITFFGTYNTQTTPRIQVMIDGLRDHSVQVNQCNVPLPIDTAGRVAILRQPWQLPWLGLSIISCWLRLIRLKRRMPASEAVIVGHLGQFDVHLARRLFRHQPIILDYMISGSDTARDRKLQGGLKDRLLTWLDNSALRAADIVVVDTEEHRLALPEAYRDKGLVVAVGAPAAWFEAAKPAAPAGKRPLKVIFFGSYIPLHGATTIAKALTLVKQPMEVTMVGNGQDLEAAKQAAKQAPFINWTDWPPSDELPALAAEYDVCLGIFGTSDKAQRAVPNKVYQGAAAGCAIVTSDTPPQRRALGDAAVFVPAGDAKALATALGRLASQPAEVKHLRRAAHERAEAYFTPQKIMLPLLEKINKPV